MTGRCRSRSRTYYPAARACWPSVPLVTTPCITALLDRAAASGLDPLHKTTRAGAHGYAVGDVGLPCHGRRRVRDADTA